MPTVPQETVTRLLNTLATGDAAAADELMPIVYDELRAMAGAMLRDQRRGHTLQATALVNEAYLKLAAAPVRAQCRAQFMLLASRAMRSILVDHARARRRLKRGGDQQRVSLMSADGAETGPDQIDLIALDEALTRLAELDERKAKLIELRFFAGLSLEDAADALGVARSTASEDARTARAWLARQLEGPS
ncbi:MAG: ECF-type sigma factor [Phycisphaerales bacterium]